MRGVKSYTARKNGFRFEITKRNFEDTYSVLVQHYKFDIRFNTFWEELEFTINDAQKWCEEFDYTKWSCIGTGVNEDL